MKKWNLYELFSLYNTEKNDLPPISQQIEVSPERVNELVMQKIKHSPQQQKNIKHKRKYKITAFLIAAAILISGSAVSVAAAGGFNQLFDFFFGKNTEYPAVIQDLYTIPKVEIIKDTCKEIDIEVVGIFGDDNTVNIVFDYIADENISFNDDNIPQMLKHRLNISNMPGKEDKTLNGFGATYKFERDSEKPHHIYQTMTITGCNFNDKILEFSTGTLVKGNAESYSEIKIKRMFGFTGSEINKSVPFTKEQLKELKSNYYHSGNYYYDKDDIIADGEISLKVYLEYPEYEYIEKVIPNNSSGIDFKLSPWSAVFSWDISENAPSFIPPYSTYSSADVTVILKDKTKITGTSQNDITYLCNNSKQENNDYKNYFYLNFSKPVDPQQVEKI
ncbi:MAG: hypothetical protein IJZ64_05120, partial [Ruminococcus sp.]|nr:hypothetical protein [Ruminococcus sp.]